MCYLAGISLESLPTVSPKEAQDGNSQKKCSGFKAQPESH